ncbi:hypothetical protein [Thermomonospora umbrina]|uniref:hypothetical protein n=1 Tax=Thermomonospora umbrina TaxID=111806 RepID=UPI0011C0DD17|nr:hypothetical protein [Thermomonospora umbrina]
MLEEHGEPHLIVPLRSELVNEWILPLWLPEWNGAEDAGKEIGIERVSFIVARLIDLVLTDDAAVLDSLPPDIESALIGPLDTLASVYEGGGSLTELVVAARLVRRSVMPYLRGTHEEMESLIRSLPE